MSGTKHKESLPAQGFIKRRRVDTTDTSKIAELEAEKEEKESPEADPNTQPDTTGSDHLEPRKPPSTSSSSSSDDDGDDDIIEMERERARLAALRSQRQKTAGAPSSGDMGDGRPNDNSSKLNSYDHDVVFRNSAWRRKTGPADEAAKKKAQWNAVTNSTEDSTVFNRFMKSFFK